MLRQWMVGIVRRLLFVGLGSLWLLSVLAAMALADAGRTRQLVLGWGVVAGVLVLLGIWLAGMWMRDAATRACQPLEALAQQARSRLESLDDAPGEAPATAHWHELQVLADALDVLTQRLLEARRETESAEARRVEATAQLAASLEQQDTYIDKQTRRLQEALNVARQASEAKTRLITNTSHEIRTPLNGIIGTAEMLLHSQPLSEAQRSMLRVQLNAAHGLLTLVNDILDLSRSGAALRTERAAFDVVAEAHTVCEALRATASKKGLQLRVTAPAAYHPYRWGDRARFRQLLMSLVGNALKFTQQGEVSIEFGESETSELMVHVRDTGIGIATADFERIFEHFYQVDASFTREYGGTGLGLAIVREITDALAGHVSVSSELGQGSTFTLHLPLDLAQASDLAAPEENKPAAKAAGALRVLIVDDIDMNRDLLEMQVQALGSETAKVDGGLAAVEHADRHALDLVLLDCQMPQIDGYETARRLRALKLSRPLRIVAVTAHAQPGERERCLAAGMDDYLVKPVTMEGLGRILGEAWDLLRGTPSVKG
jgi:signal transduction histidine kinase/ActR/RegA family two-component response regulator